MGEFWFRSYNKIIGKANNAIDLEREFCRLMWVDPDALNYHLRQGHISTWLESVGEEDLAEELRRAKNMSEAQRKISKHNERMMVMHCMKVGRMH